MSFDPLFQLVEIGSSRFVQLLKVIFREHPRMHVPAAIAGISVISRDKIVSREHLDDK
jgi:hypothetical protein